jgi:hypothetical protein
LSTKDPFTLVVEKGLAGFDVEVLPNDAVPPFFANGELVVFEDILPNEGNDGIEADSSFFVTSSTTFSLLLSTKDPFTLVVEKGLAGFDVEVLPNDAVPPFFANGELVVFEDILPNEGKDGIEADSSFFVTSSISLFLLLSTKDPFTVIFEKGLAGFDVEVLPNAAVPPFFANGELVVFEDILPNEGREGFFFLLSAKDPFTPIFEKELVDFEVEVLLNDVMTPFFAKEEDSSFPNKGNPNDSLDIKRRC